MRNREQTLNELFDDFTNYLEAQNCSKSTISAYRSDFRLISRFLLEQGIGEFDKITSHVVRVYPKWLMRKELKPASIARRIKSLRSFFQWIEEEGIDHENPMRKVKAPKRDKPIPVYFSDDALRKFLSHQLSIIRWTGQLYTY